MKGKIACIVHANREATTSCGSCGNRLCDACAIKANGVDFCENCAPPNAIPLTHDEDYERLPVVDPATAERATFTLRLMAWALDFLIFAVGAFFIGLLIWALTSQFGFFLSPLSGGAAFYFFWGIVVIAGVVYSGVLTAMSGQTLGKQVCGVIVLLPDGHILPTMIAFRRSLMAIVSALPLGLGFLWALWDREGLTWHDRFAGTAVYRWEEVS